jgi:glutamine---fructose-6-phosphate transaminase (isomerizing)
MKMQGMRDVLATHMYREAEESADRVQMQLEQDATSFAQLGERLRQLQPQVVITCARGSSDHAATYARYLIETRLGLLTSSTPPSVSSVFRIRRQLPQCVFLAISQSGRSPDVLSAAAAAKAAGALVIAMVNTVDSPLAQSADICVPLWAGVESSVAATKSYICTLAATVQLVAHWANDATLLGALAEVPGQLRAAWQLDWRNLVEVLKPARNLFVLGRGVGLGVAYEAALKLKETCGLHAEGYSSAEVRHGPIAILDRDMPVLMFCQNDEARAGLETVARGLSKEGVRVLLAGSRVDGVEALPTLTSHPVIEPLLMAQSFYRAAATLSIVRGLDPDRPPRLEKATLTV